MYVHDLPALHNINTFTLSVQSGGLAELDPAWRLRDYRVSDFQLYYALRGEAFFRAGGEEWILRPGGLLLVPTDLAIDTDCPDRATVYYFHCNLRKPDGYDLCSGLDRLFLCPFPAERPEQLDRLTKSDRLFDAVQLWSLLLDDTLLLLRQTDLARQSEANYSEAVRSTMRYVQEHLSVRLSVRALADRLFLCENTLNHLFRRELGKTVGRYIDEMVCFEAQRRLLQTADPIQQISDALGFCDPFYFSRRFRAWNGKSPSAYRREGQAMHRFRAQPDD